MAKFIRTAIKDWSELRHVLAHLSLAIEELADDNKASAIEHLRSVEGLFLFGRNEEWELTRKERKKMAKREKCTDRKGGGKSKPRGTKSGKGGRKGK